jgi:hypothetical protein
MGTTRQLPRAEWKRYFDQFTKEHLRPNGSPEAATVEMISPTLGDQFQVSAVRLLGLDYDPKSEALEVLLEGLDHLIFQPKEIWVLEGEPGFVATLEILHADDSREIIYLRRAAQYADDADVLPGAPS